MELKLQLEWKLEWEWDRELGGGREGCGRGVGKGGEWDKLRDGLLASKHNPLRIGIGEPGTSSASLSTMSTHNTNSSSSRMINLEDSTKSFNTAVKSFMDMCNMKEDSGPIKGAKDDRDYNNMSIEELYKLVEYQKNHLIFMKDMGMITNQEKNECVRKIRNNNEVIGTKAGLTNNDTPNNVSN